MILFQPSFLKNWSYFYANSIRIFLVISDAEKKDFMIASAP